MYRLYVCSAPSCHVILWSITALGDSCHDSQSHDQRVHHRCVCMCVVQGHNSGFLCWHTHTHTHTNTCTHTHVHTHSSATIISHQTWTHIQYTQTHALYVQKDRGAREITTGLFLSLSLCVSLTHTHTHTHTHTQTMCIHNRLIHKPTENKKIHTDLISNDWSDN